jgi:hypothetical protein
MNPSTPSLKKKALAKELLRITTKNSIKRELNALIEGQALMLKELADNKMQFDLTNDYTRGRHEGMIIMGRDVLDNYLRFKERCKL